MTGTPVRVGLIARIFTNMPVWVAERRGYFTEAGLDVSSEVLYGVGNVTDALRQGHVEIGVGTPESVLSDPVDPTDDAALQIVGGNARKLANSLIARRGITSFEDLRGGTIGVSHPSEGTALLATEMLANHGLHAGRDYRIVAVGVAEKRWEYLQDGTIDAGLQTPPHKYIAEDAGYPELGDIAEVVPEYQFATINVRRGWARAHPEVLRRFLSAMTLATRWMYEAREGTVALATEVMGTSEDYARRDDEHFRVNRSLDPDLSLSEDGMAKVISVMTEAKTLVADTEAARRERVDLSYLPGKLGTTTGGGR